MSAAATTPQSDHHRLFFVPDEICIVCLSDGTVSANLYDQVRDHLNQTIHAHLATCHEKLRSNPALAEGFRGVLIPKPEDGLSERLKNAGNTFFTNLKRNRPSAHHLPYGSGSDVHHLFYSVGSDGDQHLRKLVLFINSEIAHRPEGQDPNGHWRIISATPNWYGAVSSDHGSPAGPPIAIPPKGSKDHPEPQRWHFQFDDGDDEKPNRKALQDIVDNQEDAAKKTGANVVIAIVDTRPAQEDIDRAVRQLGKINPLLEEVANAIGREPLNEQDIRPTHLKDVLPDWQGHLDQWHYEKDDYASNREKAEAYLETRKNFLIPDHGFFVAGIAKDIARTAKIGLVPVLDDAGMVDLLNVVDVLFNLFKNAGTDKTRYVLNLSLTFSVPRFEDLLNEWFAEYPDRHAEILQSFLADIHAIHSSLHGSLREVFTWLRERGVLVVAAAGNYHNREHATPPTKYRPEPRFPARYDDVLDNIIGVAATSLDGRTPANYSNLAQAHMPPHHAGTRSASRYSPDAGKGVAPPFSAHGIAAIGGRTTLDAAGKPVIATTKGAPLDPDDGGQDGVDAIRGIFSAKKLPVRGAPNDSGWVWWAGTSFATPIISALAALIWQTNPGAPPSKVIDTLESYADPEPIPELNCKAIYAYQKNL